MKAPLTLAAFLWLAALPTAAASDVTTFAGTSFPDAWAPELHAHDRFGRAEAGDFDGDGAADVLQLDGQHAWLLAAPDQHCAPFWLAGGAADACFLRTAGTRAERVALTTSSGLVLAQHDALNGLATLQPIAGPEWAGARLVRAVELDGLHGEDLVGVAADGSTLLFATSTAAGGFAAATGFRALADVLDLVPLEWDGDAQGELAVLSTIGLHVHDTSGAALSGWSSALPGGAIARISQVGTQVDRIAWITSYAPPAQQWLFTVSPLGLDAVLDLASLDVVAALGADFDRDGDDDLLLSHRYSHELIWIENERSVNDPQVLSFTPSEEGKRLFRVGPSEHAPANCAWPAVDDFDGDGDLDIVFAVERTRSIVTVRGDWIDERAQRVEVAAARYALGEEGGELALDLAAPSTLPAGATHVEWTLRRRASVGAFVDAAALSVGSAALPATWPLTITVAVPQLALGFDDVYDVQIRLVARDGSGERTAIFPAIVGSFATRVSIVAALAAGADAEFSLPAPMAQPPEDPTLTTVLVKSRRMSRYRENAPPTSPIPQS